MGKQLKLNLTAIPPKKQVYIYDTGGPGTFGTYRTFPTLIKGVVKGIHIKTLEIAYFQQTKRKQYYQYIQFYGLRIE